MPECRHYRIIQGLDSGDHYTSKSCIHARKAGLLISGRKGGVENTYKQIDIIKLNTNKYQ
jgi:hypothetical protein